MLEKIECLLQWPLPVPLFDLNEQDWPFPLEDVLSASQDLMLVAFNVTLDEADRRDTVQGDIEGCGCYPDRLRGPPLLERSHCIVWPVGEHRNGHPCVGRGFTGDRLLNAYNVLPSPGDALERLLE